MLAQLVYLHIEKSAGTSERALLFENYGRDDVFWHGMDSKPSRRQDAVRVDDRRVLGGHLDLVDFKDCGRKILFTAVVREPVSRAVSLFHYYAENGPEKNRRIWRRRGLDAGSMLNSIHKCGQFRDGISNTQCRRLSGQRDFQAVRQAFQSNNLVIGTFDRVDEFNRTLAEFLSWPAYSLGVHNTARRAGYQQEILAEPGLKDKILELNQEDLALYDFVHARNVLCNLPDAKFLREHLRPGLEQPEEIVNRDAIRAVRISATRPGPHQLRDDQIMIPIRIKNESHQALPMGGTRAVRASYHWYDPQGNLVEYEGARTALPTNIFPGQESEILLRVTRPEGLSPGSYKIRVCLLQLHTRWLDTLDKKHTAEVEITLPDPPKSEA